MERKRHAENTHTQRDRDRDIERGEPRKTQGALTEGEGCN
jgi:hypothetical protein